MRRATDTTDPFCRQKPEYCIGGALNADYISKKGVYNGTGIALAGESWNVGQRRIFTLYFQHYTGDIRFMECTTDQKWIGGSRTETIATDAKNASPISAVAVGLNSTQFVFDSPLTQSDCMLTAASFTSSTLTRTTSSSK